MNVRIKWLRDKVNSLNLQGMIISNPINIRYLTNIDAEGVLLITRKENIYITDGRYVEYAQSILTIDDGIIVTDIKDIAYEDYENFFLFCENVGFEENYVTYSTYKEYMHKYKVNNLVETDNIIEKQRMVKDEHEIEHIKKACEITDKCFEYLLKVIRPYMTEKEVALEIEKYFKLNSDGIAFEPIVATGPNSSMPHAIPTNRKIQNGDPILIDMGCKYNGYCSDMTRTIFMGNVTDKLKEVYNLVLKNQKQTLKELKNGANTKNLFRMVENDFKLYEYSLIHALGHSVGLELHENPRLSLKYDSNLKTNMVITNEPGIYIPGQFGIRIEDTVLVNNIDATSLTKSTKELTII